MASLLITAQKIVLLVFGYNLMYLLFIQNITMIELLGLIIMSLIIIEYSIQISRHTYDILKCNERMHDYVA